MTDIQAQVDPTPPQAIDTQAASQIASTQKPLADESERVKQLNHENAARRMEAKQLAEQLTAANAKVDSLLSELEPAKTKAGQYDAWVASESARRDAIAVNMPEHFKAIYNASNDDSVKQKAIEAYLTQANQQKQLTPVALSIPTAHPPSSKTLGEMSPQETRTIVAQGKNAAQEALRKYFGRA